MKRYFVTIFSIVSVFVFLGFFTANAQVRNTDIVMSISPQYPEPNKAAEIKLSSYSIDLSKTYISWWINNNEVSRGIGKSALSFTMGKIGTSTTITANIDTVDGQSLSKSITLLSSGVDMLWEATDSYVPPFYKGKALGTRESEFKIVAMPEVIIRGQRISSNNLSYTWRKDNNGQPKSSGWGKNYLIIKNSFLDASNEVEVDVSDVNGNKIGEGNMTVSTVTPRVVFYKRDPVLGNSNNALVNSVKIDEEGINISAVPYFFSRNELKNIEYRWFVGGREDRSLFSRKYITVKGEEGQSGAGTIRALINNTKTLFQSAERQITIEF